MSRGLVSELNAVGREEGLRDMGNEKTREPEIKDTRFGNEGCSNWDLRKPRLKDMGNGIEGYGKCD